GLADAKLLHTDSENSRRKHQRNVGFDASQVDVADGTCLEPFVRNQADRCRGAAAPREATVETLHDVSNAGLGAHVGQELGGCVGDFVRYDAVPEAVDHAKKDATIRPPKGD